MTRQPVQQAGGRPAPDAVLCEVADYVARPAGGELAYETARPCLIDALGCGFESLAYSACTKLLGPVVPATVVPSGAKVPGARWQLESVAAAFSLGAMIRWLDFNDTWLAAKCGHPPDNIGGILAVADWLSRAAIANGRAPLTVRDVLAAMIKAYEFQVCLALGNAFNGVRLDHVVRDKVATTAVVAQMRGLSRGQIVDALMQAWIESHPLRTYWQALNTGSRKSWAAADATSRGVWLALITLAGEIAYPTALSAKRWGFYGALFGGRPFALERSIRQ